MVEITAEMRRREITAILDEITWLTGSLLSRKIPASQRDEIEEATEIVKRITRRAHGG